jgi:hypothetical protein
MYVKYLFRIKLFCFGFLVVLSVNLSAQENNTNETLYWADAGIGLTSLGSGGGALALGANLQMNNLLISFQSNSHSYSDSFIFANEVEKYSDYAMLTGIASLDSSFHASIAAGVSIISGYHSITEDSWSSSEETERKDYGPYLGFVISSQLFWKAGANFGIGIKGFADINKAKILSGVTLSVFIGEFY